MILDKPRICPQIFLGMKSIFNPKNHKLFLDSDASQTMKYPFEIISLAPFRKRSASQ